MLHVAFLRSDDAHGDPPRHRCHRGAGAARRASRSTPPPTWATTGGPARCWCRRRRCRAGLQRRDPGAAGAGQGPALPAKPLAMVVAESRYLAEDALEDIVVDLEPLPAVVDLEAALAAGRAAGARAVRHQPRRPRAPAQRRLCRGAAPGARPGHPAGSATTAAPRRRSRTAGVVAAWDARAGELTVWDTTQAPIPIRNGLAAMLGPRRVAGAGDRAVHRRRLRAQDHDVLPRGSAAALGRDAAGPAAQVDRGPPGEFLRHDAGARARSTTPRSR